MNDTVKLTFPALLGNSFNSFSDLDAMAFVGEPAISYKEVETRINAVIAFLEKLGIKPGDKVSILSSNIPNWGITYFAIVSMGAVVVPLLPDFAPTEVEHILNHAEVKVLIISNALLPKISGIASERLIAFVDIEEFTLIGDVKSVVIFDQEARPEKVYQVEEDDLAAIIYTSGTAGKSKGVMLSQKNICFTALKGTTIEYFGPGDRFLSILPLSHTYENTLGLVVPIFCGSSIFYLRKAPTPAVLLPALELVKPTVMLTVPLIIEKIYRSKILPAFTGKWVIKKLYQVPFFRKKLNTVAGKKLRKTFGNQLRFFGIGGAKLDPVVEKFLLEANFPYAIGYGLTESAPLLAGFNPKHPVLQSTGPAMQGVELIIHDPDPVTGEGEIWAKGPNVMIGYYKEPVLTEETVTRDGWLKTGDLGMFDSKGYLFIKGRIKNIIIGSNGENSYPEEIESVINNFNFVVESLVLHKEGKLVALVHFNTEEIEQRFRHMKDEFSNYSERKIDELKKELHAHVNARVNKFSKLHMVITHVLPFQKTATQKIKRFLYK
jgi:long-chain acyl-CoA synthetase